MELICLRLELGKLALTPSLASLPKFSARSRLLLQRDFLAATTKAPPIIRCSALQQPNISLYLNFSIGLIPLFSGFSLFVNYLVLLETCLAFHYKSSRPPPTLTAITLKNRPTAPAITQYGELYGESLSIVSRYEARKHPAATASSTAYSVEPERAVHGFPKYTLTK